MIEKNEVIPDQQESEIQKRRYSRLMQMLSFVMVVISLVAFILIMAIDGPVEIIIYMVFSAVVFFFFCIVFQKQHVSAGSYGLVYFSCLNCFVGNILIGWRSGIYILFFLMIPVIFYNPVIQNLKKMLQGFCCGAFFLATIVLGFLITPTIRFNTFQLQLMNSMNVFVTCLILAVISYIEFQNSNRVAVRLIELNNKLAYHASRDSLTNLFNRRTMSQYIQMEYVRSKRSGKGFGLIMADVDDFKVVNDNYGHAAGDLVLIELAGLLSATLRKQDLISRWGGEEFLILLPETDLEGVQIASEKVRELISHSSVPYQGHDIQITLSIGGVICERETNWDDCIKTADRALYYGKTHGKNMAVFAKGEQYCILGHSDSGFTH